MDGLEVRLMYSLFCGFIIGLERQIRGKPVDVRTSMLICVGTMLYIFLGTHVNQGIDAGRILGQVVTGVGFLGGGVIMTKEGLVSGVTSASVVWLLAGIGAAIGLGYYSTGVLLSIVALVILIGVEFLEDVFKALPRAVRKHEKEDKQNH